MDYFFNCHEPNTGKPKPRHGLVIKSLIALVKLDYSFATDR